MAVLGIDDAEIPEDIEKTIIEILANKIAIKSDNFELTKNGVIKALAGIIAGLTMTEQSNGSYLYKNYTVDGKTYQSGLFIPKEGTGTEAFLYAGLDISGDFFVDFDSGNRALDFSKDHIDWRLDNERNNRWFSIFKATNGHWFSLFDAPLLGVMDGVHTKNLMTIYRQTDTNPASTNFYSNTQ